MKLNKQCILFFISVAILQGLLSVAYGEVIFTENFNNQPDWQPHPATNAQDGYAYCDIDWCGGLQPPPGWTYYRTTGQWWGPMYHDTLRIKATADNSTDVGRGGSGKALVVYNESNSGGDGWGADGQLTKVFDQDYQELYIRAWIKTQAGWQWPSSDDMMIKMFRVGHFDKTGSAYAFFWSGNTAPLYLWDFKHSNTWGTRGMDSFRGDPQATRYNSGSPSDLDNDFLLKAGDTSIEPNGAGMLADTQYHRLDFHVKMNTLSGTTWNSNGVLEFWYDGMLKSIKTNVKWKDTGSTEAIGWNMVGFGGNAYNTFSATENKLEQWYAIDDIVVSTTPILTITNIR